MHTLRCNKTDKNVTENFQWGMKKSTFVIIVILDWPIIVCSVETLHHEHIYREAVMRKGRKSASLTDEVNLVAVNYKLVSELAKRPGIWEQV